MAEKVTDITSLFKTFKSDREKQEFCEMQFALSVAHVKQIQELETEIKHLKELLTSTTQLLEPSKIIATPEEVLINSQILILERRSNDGKELTLEEVKKLDLLVKNKNLIKQQPTTIQGESKPLKSFLSKKELLVLASKKDDEN